MPAEEVDAPDIYLSLNKVTPRSKWGAPVSTVAMFIKCRMQTASWKVISGYPGV
jgi:hypothetical protein